MFLILLIDAIFFSVIYALARQPIYADSLAMPITQQKKRKEMEKYLNLEQFISLSLDEAL